MKSTMIRNAVEDSPLFHEQICYIAIGVVIYHFLLTQFADDALLNHPFPP